MDEMTQNAGTPVMDHYGRHGSVVGSYLHRELATTFVVVRWSDGSESSVPRQDVRPVAQVEIEREWSGVAGEIAAWDAEIADDIRCHQEWIAALDAENAARKRRSLAGSCRESMSAGGICGLPVMDNDPINLFCTDHSMKRWEAAVERDQEARAYLSCDRHEECDGEPCQY